MMIIEMREAAYEKAFGLLDEIKDLGKKKKMVLCELEDTLYECYEASKDKDDEEYGESSEYEAPGSEYGEDSSDIDFRRRRGMRKGMRSGMRHYDDVREDGMRYRRSGMRNRDRYGRYSY